MQADPRHLRYALPSWAFLSCEPILGIYLWPFWAFLSCEPILGIYLWPFWAFLSCKPILGIYAMLCPPGRSSYVSRSSASTLPACKYMQILRCGWVGQSSCMQIHADTQVWVGGTEKTAFCSVRSDDGSADVRASNSSNNHNRQFSFLFLFFSGGVLGASAGTFRVCTVHQVLQVFVLAPSRTLNVIRARCSGSLYFQFLADKSRRQAGRQAG